MFKGNNNLWSKIGYKHTSKTSKTNLYITSLLKLNSKHTTVPKSPAQQPLYVARISQERS